ncbi:MAG: ABC transporter permease [Elainellaceae cyanobacterium]
MAASTSSDSVELKRPPIGWAARLRKLIQPIVLLGPSGLWLLLLLVMPTLLITEISLVPNLRPEDPIANYSFANYIHIFEGFGLSFQNSFPFVSVEGVYIRVILRTFYFGIGATVLCLLLGFPVAYWIAIMSPQRWRNLFLVVFVLPLWTSSLLRAYAWISILRPTGVLNTLLGFAHLPTLDFLHRDVAVFIGLSYSFLPYMVLILYASLEKLDRRLLEAAADLGAAPSETFWKITVPQTMPGITAGCLLVFITSAGDFVNPELLGPPSMTIPRLIYNQFLTVRNWGFGSALSMILILGVSLAIALLIKYGDRNAETLS